MNGLALARWQFAITTVYHFFFVPLTLGLAILVAIMETLYVRTGDETWKRMTKFWGKLFLINFAMGVVTGIVQEFQFGMNWSEYSRFVGRHFRRAAGDRGAAGLLPGIDLPRHVDLRLGEALQAGAPGDDLAGRHRLEPLGAVDPDRQLLHAGAGRLRGPQRPC